MIEVSQFSGCCGIYIAYGMGNDKDGDNSEYSIKEVEKDLQNRINSCSGGLMLVALNENQIDRYAKMMDRLAFKPLVNEFMHYGHGNTITLYGHIITQENAMRNLPGIMSSGSLFKKMKDHWGARMENDDF